MRSCLLLVLVASSCTPGASSGGGSDPDGGDAAAAGDTTPVGSVPTAVLSLDTSLLTGGLATVDGSGSSDADGDPLTYAWTFIRRPPTSAAAFADAGASMTTFTPDVSGDYEIALSVSDGGNEAVRVGTATARPLLVVEAGAGDGADLLRAQGFEVVTGAEPGSAHLAVDGDFAVWTEDDGLAPTFALRGRELSTGATFLIDDVPRGAPRLSAGFASWDLSAQSGVAWDLAARAPAAFGVGAYFLALPGHAIWRGAGGVVVRDLAAATDTTLPPGTEPNPSGSDAFVTDGRVFAWRTYAAVLAYDPGSSQLVTVRATTSSIDPIVARDGVVAWGEGDGHIWGWASAGGAAFEVDSSGSAEPLTVSTADGAIAWSRLEGSSVLEPNIHVYDVSAASEVTVSSDPTGRRPNAMAGARVFWSDSRSGDVDVWAYDTVAGSEVAVTSLPGDQYVLAAGGTFVCWSDRAGPGETLACHDFTADTTFTLSSIDGHKTALALTGEHALWLDRRSGFSEVFHSGDRGATEERSSSPVDAAGFVGGFGAVVMVGWNPGSLALALASAAQPSTGVISFEPTLHAESGGGCGCGCGGGCGCGFSPVAPPETVAALSGALVAFDLADLQVGMASENPVSIVASAEGLDAGLFAGVTTAPSLVLATWTAGSSTEVVCYPLAVGGTQPLDWSVLATFDAADIGGTPAIVLFRTTSGATVMLDGTGAVSTNVDEEQRRLELIRNELSILTAP